MYSFQSKKLVLVYQMGKVASRSIERSLTEAGYVSPSPHTMNKLIHNTNYPNYKNPECKDLRLLIAGYYLVIRKRVLLFFYKRRKMKIITLVREPIVRNISMYFQNLEIPLMHIAHNYPITTVENTSLQKLIDEYFINYNQRAGIDWFDNELKKNFGIDVYQYDFDKERGYSTIKKDKVEVLIIKFEKMREIGEKCIGEFIGDANFKINDYNISSDKWYAPVYDNFKKGIEFSDEYLDELLHNKFMKHFYTDEEIVEFYNKYKGSNKSKKIGKEQVT